MSSLQSIDKLCFLHFPITPYIALLALSNNSLMLKLNEPFLVKVTPEYLKVLTISSISLLYIKTVLEVEVRLPRFVDAGYFDLYTISKARTNVTQNDSEI
jgi:hypothetical protein